MSIKQKANSSASTLPCVLIVDDEPGLLSTLRYVLESEGLQVMQAGSGEDALEIFRKVSVHAIVLDIGLPGISGFEVCKRIRESSDLPILFLSARSDEVDKILGFDFGADDYVSKPFSPREVCARVKAMLRRRDKSQASEDTKVSFPFHVDEARRRITFYGKLLSLSKIEFDLLRTFILHPGHVFSRSRLMELHWEDPFMSLERTVDAHIKALRAKLRDGTEDEDIIRTHRGVGYSLKDNW